MSNEFGAMEPRSVTARKLNALVKRVEELEAALSNSGATQKEETKQVDEKPTKARAKKADPVAPEPTPEPVVDVDTEATAATE